MKYFLNTLFWLSTVGVVILLYTGIRNLNLNILFSILTCSSALVILFNKKIRIEYFHSDYLKPTYWTLSITFGLIALFFGLNSEVMQQHDKNEQNKSITKWYNIDSIFKYPNDQLELDKGPDSNIITFNIPDTTSKNHIILLDRTTYPNDKNRYLKYSTPIIDYTKISCCDIDSNQPKLNIKSIITSYISCRFLNAATYHKNENLFTYAYIGIPDTLIPFFNATNIEDINREKEKFQKTSKGLQYIDYVNIVIDGIESKKRGIQRTNFVTVFNLLEKEINRIKDTTVNTLTIISDFLHEEKYKGRSYNKKVSDTNDVFIDEVETALKRLLKYSKIKTVNIIKVTKAREDEKTFPRIDALLRSQLEFNYQLKDINIEDLNLGRIKNGLETSLVTWIDDKKKRQITLQHPYDGISTNDVNKTILKLELDHPDEVVFFLGNIRSGQDDKSTRAKLAFINTNDKRQKSEESLLLNEYSSVMPIRNELNLSAAFYPNNERVSNNEYFIDIFLLKSRVAKRYYISFTPRLNTTIAFGLLWIYLLFLTALSLLCLLPMLKRSFEMNNIQWQRRAVLVLGFILTCSIEKVCYAFYMATLSTQNTASFIIPILIFVFFLVALSLRLTNEKIQST